MEKHRIVLRRRQQEAGNIEPDSHCHGKRYGQSPSRNRIDRYGMNMWILLLPAQAATVDSATEHNGNRSMRASYSSVMTSQLIKKLMHKKVNRQHHKDTQMSRN